MSRIDALRNRAPVRMVIITAAVALSLTAASVAEILEFAAPIDGIQAANCMGTGSAGTGFGALTLDTDTGEVNYNITFSGLGAPETVAHVHGPAPECFSSLALYDLPTGSPKIGSVILDAQDQADMIAGLHYINIHTEDFIQAGEIRGQILLAKNGIPAASTWGLIIMATMLLTAGAVLVGRPRAPVPGA